MPNIIGFDLTFNFEGQTFQGYSAIYQTPKKAAPEGVDLLDGEGLSGPYWFGRAFDAPPFFTYSAVNRTAGTNASITCGIAEWHRDEQDMFIGATIWIKATAPDSIGTDANCSDNIIYGANILRDPGFEKIAAYPKELTSPYLSSSTINNPDYMTFPGDSFSAGGFNPGSLYWYTTKITDPFWYEINSWAVWSNNINTIAIGNDPGFLTATPYVSDANPRSGKYHYRVTLQDGFQYSGQETYPIPVGGRYCNVSGPQGYTARVSCGDTVHAWCHVMVNTLADEPTQGYENAVLISWYDENAQKISDAGDYAPYGISTSYQKFEDSWVAPEGAYACVVEFYFDVSGAEAGQFLPIGNGPIHLDIDDCGVGVIPGGGDCCTEDPEYGNNILRDPDFDGYASLVGLATGPDGETFPGELSWSTLPPNLVQWSGGSLYAGPEPLPWACFTNFGEVSNNDVMQTNRWHLSTAAPYSGTYHARFQVPSPAEFSGSGATFQRTQGSLRPIGLETCLTVDEISSNPVFDGVDDPGRWTARINPGDYVEFTVYAKATSLVDQPWITLQGEIWTESNSLITDGTNYPNFFEFGYLGTSYSAFTFTFTAPANSYYLGLELVCDIDGDFGTPTVHTDYDIGFVALRVVPA